MSAHLDERALLFLRESNAIEGIENIDYSKEENARPDRGQVGAFMQTWQMAKEHKLLTLDDVRRWQALLTEEQVRFGHSRPGRSIQRHRGIAHSTGIFKSRFVGR